MEWSESAYMNNMILFILSCLVFAKRGHVFAVVRKRFSDLRNHLNGTTH